MEATVTDFLPWQFKPVLKMLAFPTVGLLVADEVGLGKTIEAGLIWTELRARFDYRRLLALCPKSLCRTWQDELDYRFGVQARIADAAELVEELRRARGSDRAFALIYSMQGLRLRRSRDPRSDERSQSPQ
jgi:SNF2 family DNA or RNA helicase